MPRLFFIDAIRRRHAFRHIDMPMMLYATPHADDTPPTLILMNISPFTPHTPEMKAERQLLATPPRATLIRCWPHTPIISAGWPAAVLSYRLRR